MSQDQIGPKHTRLSGLDREIAVRAIAALARGTPVEAAYQILAGIEALDAGPEAPMVVLWPESTRYKSVEDLAAWHAAEEKRLLWAAGASTRARKLAKQLKAASSSSPASSDPHELAAHPGHPAFQQCSAPLPSSARAPSIQGAEELAASLGASVGRPLGANGE